MQDAEQVKIRNDEVEWEPRPTLSGQDYASLGVWAQERERIWWGDWVCVGRAEEVANPGDFVVRDLAGESIFVTRNDEGERRGFYNVCSYIAYPKDPDHTTVVSEYLFRPETIGGPDFKPEPVIEFWDLISWQDWDVCERAQTGVSSRSFTTGVYPRQDRFLYWFNEEYRRAMGRPVPG